MQICHKRKTTRLSFNDFDNGNSKSNKNDDCNKMLTKTTTIRVQAAGLPCIDYRNILSRLQKPHFGHKLPAN